jgi:hypothetical protein
MGMHPRWYKAGSVYALTQRTVDRAFLFKPSPAIQNIIGASAARAQQKHPIKLHWLETNINHEQIGLSPKDESQESMTNVAKFKQTYHRLLAEEINRLLDREGAIFSTPSRDVECLDNESVAQQMGYAMTNPVKDGLVDKTSHWKGFSSYGAVARGEDPVYTYFDRTAWHNAGGVRSKKPLQAFMKTIRLEYTPSPGTEHLSENQRQAMIRRECRALEQQFREERRQNEKTVMSETKMEKLDPRDRPRSKPKRTRKPLCHAATKEAAQAYVESFRAFLDAYRVASCSYRSGCGDVDFPSGSFKPPLIEAAA